MKASAWAAGLLALVVVPYFLQATPIAFVIRLLGIVGLDMLPALRLNLVIGFGGLLDPLQLASDPAMARAVSMLDERSAALANWEAELSALERAGALAVPRLELAQSYTHMAINRLLLSDHLAQEMVLYDLLDRAYAAAAALGRSRPFGGRDQETQGGQAE